MFYYLIAIVINEVHYALQHPSSHTGIHKCIFIYIETFYDGLICNQSYYTS